MFPGNWVLATGNPGKVREIRERMQREFGADISTLDDFSPLDPPEEPFETFAENAIHKARYYARHLGKTVLAEDSGLEVDALGGSPGVYSARYAGEPCDNAKNNRKLLRELAQTADAARTARYVAVAALVGDDIELTFRGTCEGRIARQEMGAHGFGYDPLFIPRGYSETFGVLDLSIKRSISHRMQALDQLVAWIKEQA